MQLTSVHRERLQIIRCEQHEMIARREGEREREGECVAVRGLYWRCEYAEKHSGASCYRPYKGQGPCASAHLRYS